MRKEKCGEWAATCAECGRQFNGFSPRGQYKYACRDKHDGKALKFCSWECFDRWQKGQSPNYFVISEKLPSLNEVINLNRSNRFAASKQKKHLQEVIGEYIIDALEHKHLQRMRKACEIYMEFTEENHRRDVDNVQSAQKFILDAMVEYGILENDSPKYVKQIYHKIAYGDHYSCRVEIYEDRKALERLEKRDDS